jgi:hypothetical protein
MGALDKDKEVHKIKSSYHLIRVDKLNGRRNFPFIPDFYQCLMFAGKKMFGDILPLGGFTRLDVATKSLKYYRIYGFDQVNTIQQIKTADVEWARIPCRGEFSLFYNYGVWYSFRNE